MTLQGFCGSVGPLKPVSLLSHYQLSTSSTSKRHILNYSCPGVIVALPKRTVGAELHYDLNKKGEKVGNLKLEADLWLNKEKNDKLCFIATTDVSRSKDGTIVTGETKLTHPALKKVSL